MVDMYSPATGGSNNLSFWGTIISPFGDMQAILGLLAHVSRAQSRNQKLLVVRVPIIYEPRCLGHIREFFFNFEKNSFSNLSRFFRFLLTLDPK